MKPYDHKKIEKKWQKEWEEQGIYKTQDNSNLPKQYILDMFPYPSGEGLHVGHPRGYIATDVFGRMKRMSGFNVLHPMGWDAFGLPAENYAIKNKVHPRVAVEKNVARFKEQLSLMGFDYDWSREIDTTDPKFYKWTQWIFLQMFKKGLAYESFEPINWCPSCQTGLANEDVEADGTCERCGTKVEKKPMRQWVLKITDYADRMLVDLDKLPKWPEWVKEAQRNWIGKSEGSEIEFAIKDSDKKIKVFTTRADTLFGSTYVVLAPEHPFVATLPVSNREEVDVYVRTAGEKDETDRTNAKKEKTGVQLQGVMAVNPANGELIPVWISDYVLASYGTGAVMAVPAHDERDFEFAKKYDLPMKQVVIPVLFDTKNPPITGKQNTTRDTVHVILRNPKNKTVYVQFLKGEKWKGNEPVNFIIGGIEEGETEIETAVREIREETGYTDVLFVEKVSFDTQANFFAAHKDVNRSIHVRTLVFDLVSDAQIAIEEDEYFTKDSHEMKWIPYEKVGETITIPDDRIAWKYYQTGGFAYTDDGVLTGSGKFDGMKSEEARKSITEFVVGKLVSTYRIKDWVFSRQRYWGEPIPLVHCEKCGVVGVPESELPVLLPEVSHYEPTGTGESPLAGILEWVNTKCPTCGGSAKRETNTMPQWAGSSWYYLRFIDSNNNDALIDPQKEKEWMPVDVYVGADHATRHLIYARFWHKFLYDIGVVSTEEPFPRLEFLGYIMAEDGRKMSKRWKNIVNPDDVIAQFGADAFRLYEMFIGPFESTVPWNTDGLVGTYRFIEKVWNIVPKLVSDSSDAKIENLLHKTIKKVSEDIENFKFNTAVSALMIFMNEATKGKLGTDDFKLFLQLLAPFAPHSTEEIWQSLGNEKSVHLSVWPIHDPKKIIDDEVTIGIQVGGKIRAEMTIAVDADEESVKSMAIAHEKILPWIAGKEIRKVIYVKGRLVNIVV